MNSQTRVLEKEDIPDLVDFLSDPLVDSEFVKPLSQRSQSIEERVNYYYYYNGFWLIAIDNDKFYACVAVAYDKDEELASISTSYISPDYRKDDFYKGFIEDCIDKSIELYNPKAIIVDSWKGNKNVDRLGERLGFKIIDEYEDTEKRPEGVKTVVYRLDLR